jgi:hypothetical protein
MKSAIKAALRPAYHLAKRVLSEPPSAVKPFKSDDEILAWMKFINPGMLRASNLDLFAHCIERLPSIAPVVEIGSFAGLSLNHIIYLLRRAKLPNPVFSVDAWTFERSNSGEHLEGSCGVTVSSYREHAIDTFRRNVILFSSDRLPHHIQLSSDQFFAAWRAKEKRTDYFDRPATLGGPISFAYIDGDHTYEQSKRDFENVDRHLEVGGFIVFDDSGDDTTWGSKKTAHEAAGLPNYELVAKNPNYCIRKIG